MRIIAGKYGRRRFDVPTNITARPTTDFARENIFNVLNGLADIEGGRVLDLFAGTGAVSLEFLSRGASQVTAVEKAAVQHRFISKTLQTLGDPHMRVVRGDALRYLAAPPAAEGPYDIIFADPPYDMPGFAQVPARIMASPLVKDGTLVIVEHSRAHDFSALPGFIDHRAYGSVNFSIFRINTNNRI